MNTDHVRYDVSDLRHDALEQLGEILDRMRIAHAIELGVLLVHADDELMTDIAIDEVERTCTDAG